MILRGSPVAVHQCSSCGSAAQHSRCRKPAAARAPHKDPEQSRQHRAQAAEGMILPVNVCVCMPWHAHICVSSGAQAAPGLDLGSPVAVHQCSSCGSAAQHSRCRKAAEARAPHRRPRAEQAAQHASSGRLHDTAGHPVVVPQYSSCGSAPQHSRHSNPPATRTPHRRPRAKQAAQRASNERLHDTAGDCTWCMP
jgi:hypothetical protein